MKAKLLYSDEYYDSEGHHRMRAWDNGIIEDEIVTPSEESVDKLIEEQEKRDADDASKKAVRDSALEKIRISTGMTDEEIKAIL